MSETRTETYDQDLKDAQNAEIEADHEARRTRLGHGRQVEEETPARAQISERKAARSAEAPAKKATKATKAAAKKKP